MITINELRKLAKQVWPKNIKVRVERLDQWYNNRWHAEASGMLNLNEGNNGWGSISIMLPSNEQARKTLAAALTALAEKPKRTKCFPNV